MRFTLGLTALFSSFALFASGAPSGPLTGRWILDDVGVGKNRIHEVELVEATEAEGGGYWLVGVEGVGLVMEGRYLLQRERLVKIEGGAAIYQGIAYRLEASTWVWDGDAGNRHLKPYAGSSLRRPRPMKPTDKFNELGHSRLYIAALDGDSAKIEELLAKGETVDIRNTDQRGRSALYAAIDMGYLDIVSLLIKRGAEVNQSDKHGTTPLMAAGQSGGPYRQLVRTLLDAGADPQAQDRQKLTAARRLEKAKALGFEQILLEEILARKPAPESESSSGAKTP